MKPLSSIGIIAFEKKQAILQAIHGMAGDPSFRAQRFFFNRSIFSFKCPGIKALPNRAFLKRVDVAVSFGGDGSFLSAARLVMEAGIPLVGVNMGSLGFLTDVPANRASEELAKIFKGRYTIEKRMMFDVALLRKEKVIARDVCLNDINVRGSRLFNLAVYHGGELVSGYNADGLIVSTPTGSTAYSMAAGGPIVYPTLECVIIAPICSHSLTQKPIVSAIRKPVVLKITDARAKATLSIDGKQTFALIEGDEIRVSRSKFVTTLIKPEGASYFSLLRKKLNWGKPAA